MSEVNRTIPDDKLNEMIADTRKWMTSNAVSSKRDILRSFAVDEIHLVIMDITQKLILASQSAEYSGFSQKDTVIRVLGILGVDFHSLPTADENSWVLSEWYIHRGITDQRMAVSPEHTSLINDRMSSLRKVLRNPELYDYFTHDVWDVDLIKQAMADDVEPSILASMVVRR